MNHRALDHSLQGQARGDEKHGRGLLRARFSETVLCGVEIVEDENVGKTVKFGAEWILV
jgi:hypothetical protein